MNECLNVECVLDFKDSWMIIECRCDCLYVGNTSMIQTHDPGNMIMHSSNEPKVHGGYECSYEIDAQFPWNKETNHKNASSKGKPTVFKWESSVEMKMRHKEGEEAIRIANQ